MGSNRKEVMANKVITLVIDTLEADLDSVLAAAINELHSLGHTVKQVRVMDDSGETVIPTNTVAGVTVHEPVTGEAEPPAAPAPTDTPTDTPDVPVDTPVDPTSVTPDTTPSTPSTS